MEFKDKFNFKIQVSGEYKEKISNKKPPVSLEMLQEILKSPDYVMVSSSSKSKRCYYKYFEHGLFKAVIKYIESTDEHWISTAHKTDGVREKEVFNEDLV